MTIAARLLQPILIGTCVALITTPLHTPFIVDLGIIGLFLMLINRLNDIKELLSTPEEELDATKD